MVVWEPICTYEPEGTHDADSVRYSRMMQTGRERLRYPRWTSSLALAGVFALHELVTGMPHGSCIQYASELWRVAIWRGCIEAS
jgi:hypothetical protein